MSASLWLHDFIIATLKADTSVAAKVGKRVYDYPPEGVAYPYISIGAMDAVPVDADCIMAREETVQVDIWHRDQGRKWKLAETMDAVKDALHEAEAASTSHGLVECRVVLMRRFMDPDGLTAHGVVQVTATMEE